MKIKYFSILILLLIIFNACNHAETKEAGIKYIVEENQEVLNDLFENQKNVVSRSSAIVNLHKAKSDNLVEEIGQIYWYQQWTFDSLRNEYIPQGDVICKLKNGNKKIDLSQQARIEGINYYEQNGTQEWYQALYLNVKEKRKGDWGFSRVIEFRYEKKINENEVIVLEPNISMGTSDVYDVPAYRKKYYCKFHYSNIIISPNNEEALRELYLG